MILNSEGSFPIIESSNPGIIELLPKTSLKSTEEFPSNSSPLIIPVKSMMT